MTNPRLRQRSSRLERVWNRTAMSAWAGPCTTVLTCLSTALGPHGAAIYPTGLVAWLVWSGSDSPRVDLRRLGDNETGGADGRTRQAAGIGAVEAHLLSDTVTCAMSATLL